MSTSEAPVALSQRPRRVAVVGAGLTGLALAHRLHVDHPDLEVVVLEAGERPGGKILTAAFAELPVDAAADAFLARVPEGTALCEELGFADQLVSPATRSAYLWARGALRQLPPGLVLGVPTDLDALERSGIVSPDGIARLAQDVASEGAARDLPGGDESVGDLVRRRLGDEAFELLVAPLLGGINAGNADRLSLAAGAPQLAAAARRASLIDGARAQVAASSTAADTPIFQGFATGTGTLVAALVDALPAGSLHLDTAVTGIRPHAGGFDVDLRVGSPGTDRPERLTADAIALAVPAYAAADLVAHLPGDLGAVADELDAIEWASVAMCVLDVHAQRLDHTLDASGYLVPVAERRTVTACSFASSKWAHLRRSDRILLRASAGHADDEEPVHLDDDELLTRVAEDLGEHLGMHGPPEAVRITRWPRSLPQYRPGHLDRAHAIQRRVWDEHPGLWLTGASFEGLGLPACIRQAWAGAAVLAGGADRPDHERETRA